MDLSICINTYYGTNPYRFRQLLASLFVEPNIDVWSKQIQKYIELLKTLGTEDNFDTIVNIVNAWFKSEVCGNCLRNANNILVKQKDKNLVIPMSDKLITFIMLLTDSNSHFSVLNCMTTEDNKNKFNIFDEHNLNMIYKYHENITQYLMYVLQAMVVKTYISKNNNFETIQDYIKDMLSNGFKLTNLELLYDKKLQFTFMIDGFSGIKYETFERFYATLPYKLFVEINNKNNLKLNYLTYKLHPEYEYVFKNYYILEFENKYPDLSIKTIHDIIKEFASLMPFKIILDGTKYKTTVQINRNIFLKNNHDKIVEFLDDDDFSGSIVARYNYAINGLNTMMHRYEQNKFKMMKLLKAVDSSVNTNELSKLNLIQFRYFMLEYYTELMNKYCPQKINHATVLNVKQKYKNELEKIKELIDEVKKYNLLNCHAIELNSKIVKIMHGFWEIIILPFM